MPSVSGIIPRFDFKQAQLLLQKGKTSSEVIAAAERLGDDQLKQQIVMYVSSRGVPLEHSVVGGRPKGELPSGQQ
jgi:hypothetical protein